MALANLSRFWHDGKPSGLAVIVFGTILIGAGLAVGARVALDRLLAIQSGAAFELDVSGAAGDCGTPSLYVLPSGSAADSRYDVLVDFLGGGNRFPRLGGVAATTPVLALPEDRPPGVGLGRGLLAGCASMDLTIRGPFTYAGSAASFPGVDMLPMAESANVSVANRGPGLLELRYRARSGGKENDALATVTLTGISDLWQYAYKRAAFTNQGAHDVNVFFYQEPGFLFVNSNDNVVRPINTNRSFADAHLSAASDQSQNSVVIYRRKPTSDIELQHALISISTVFGIGVSLLVEGVVFGLITLATGRRHEVE